MSDFNLVHVAAFLCGVVAGAVVLILHRWWRIR